MATPAGPRLARRQRQQRMGARAGRSAAAAVQCATLQVPLPVRPTAAECGALLKALIKHLLFQRAQIPYLYDELLRAAQEQQRAAAEEAAQAATEGRRVRRRRMPKGDRRLLKFLGKAEELLASVDGALGALGVPPRAFLLLGSSTAKPREAYEILLPMPAEEAAAGPPPALAAAADAAAAAAAEAQQQHGTHPEAQAQQAAPPGRPRAPRQQRLCQLAVRQLVVAGAELPEGTAHTVPCKLFLLLDGGPAGAESGANQPPYAASSSDAMAHQLAAPPPPGFSVKRQFRLSMRKGMHLRVQLCPRDELEQRQQQQQLEEQAAAAEAAAAEAAAQAMPGEGSMEESQGEAPAPGTMHLSQLPDAAPASPEALAEQASTAAAAAAAAAAFSTAGSVWFLCRTTLKGLNDGGRDDGAEG